MAIEGTYAFNPDFGEIIEEAYERAGLELRSGYDLRTARRSLNFLTLEWQNRGINLWTIGEEKVSETSGGVALTDNALVSGTASYKIDIDTISLLDVVLRTNDGNATTQTDYHMSRISEPTYATIPNKLTTGRPLQYYFQRIGIRDTSSVAPVNQNDLITLWPVPDSTTTYKIVYWRIKRISDTGKSAANTADIPARFLSPLAAGLAYHIACKRPEVVDRVQMLKQQYDELFREAADEDRDKTSARFVPYIPSY
tara:strand:+ start:2341 stop:3102 length:762 start_codon:yes stop_codon:yes gene_type:complete